MRRLLLTLSVVCAAAGCLLVTDQYGSSPCTKNTDCPAVTGYLCVSTASWPQVPCGKNEKDCACEVTFPPAPFMPMDAGVDAGPPPDYCRDIKPLMTNNCVFTCHGPQMGYPGSPNDFRLDYYGTPTLPDGGKGIGGIGSVLPRVDAQTYSLMLMPPTAADAPPVVMTQAQRLLVHRWVQAGAPGAPGSCETDAGMSDGGAPVSFATDLVPVFMQFCVSCHGSTSPMAGLDLTAANAYSQLVNVNVSSGCNGGMGKRVVPNMIGSSMLWLKLSNNPAKCNAYEPNGAAMPFNASNPVEFGKIDSWIKQGAANN
jgi:hypothetical protein